MEGSVTKIATIRHAIFFGSKTMRIAVLTTGAVRRRYFVEKLGERFPITRVFIETRDPPPPIPTDHPSDDARKARERTYWYDGAPPSFADIVETQSYESLNDPNALSALQEIKPDVMLVYGTGKLDDGILDICPQTCLNFHNGDPERYRGLDCHLWPLYHRDFDALQMTLHKIEASLDTGDIVERRPVPLYKNMPLADLRRAACEISVEMAVAALDSFKRTGKFEAAAQRHKGRYYSYMPAVLKDISIRNFERHTASL
jgi:methionyl-tRNA formyltransferase